VTWIGILVCLAHSAAFSGLNLALLSVTRLRLEVEAASGDLRAKRILDLRRNMHLLLTTILWGNVAFNTLLAILSSSIMTGVMAFLFSTLFITFFGEIVPQAYFSKHALKVGAALVPLIRFYQVVLYPVAKPCSMLLDYWLGKEGIRYYQEHHLQEIIRRHVESEEADIDRLEGIGALNFLSLDDLPVGHEGERLDSESVITLPTEKGFPVFPDMSAAESQGFLRSVNKSGHKWVIIVDSENDPKLVLDADGFLRAVTFDAKGCNILRYCHRPIIVRSNMILLDDVLPRMYVTPESPDDDVVDHDIILVWADERRIITGADILGRLLRGIVKRKRR
jgi:hypothetical protein